MHPWPAASAPYGYLVGIWNPQVRPDPFLTNVQFKQELWASHVKLAFGFSDWSEGVSIISAMTLKCVIFLL